MIILILAPPLSLDNFQVFSKNKAYTSKCGRTFRTFAFTKSLIQPRALVTEIKDNYYFMAIGYRMACWKLYFPLCFRKSNSQQCMFLFPLVFKCSAY